MTPVETNGRDVLILSWSATGRARKVAAELERTLTKSQLSVVHCDVSRGELVQFGFHRFFSMLAPVVLEQNVPDFAHWVYQPGSNAKPDLVVMVWPIWFLSVPAFVSHSLIHMSKTWHGVPILTVVTCRRAWISAALRWREILAAHSMPFCGIHVLRESRPGLLSFFLTPLRILFHRGPTPDFGHDSLENKELVRISSAIIQARHENEAEADTSLKKAIASDSLAVLETQARARFDAYAKFLTHNNWASTDNPSHTPRAVNILTMIFILAIGISAHFLQLFKKRKPMNRQLLNTEMSTF